MDDEAQRLPATGELEVIRICDAVHDQYQVLHVGWARGERVFTVVCHLRLRDGKVWIERDGTAEGVATQLLDAGIPWEDIVLAFYPAWKRAYTEFAIA
ncbi:MAG TPA: XisI protein [Chloroflexota bacterium]|nr:XisI protein [Chloroflexota bacterium]